MHARQDRNVIIQTAQFVCVPKYSERGEDKKKMGVGRWIMMRRQQVLFLYQKHMIACSARIHTETLVCMHSDISSKIL